MDHREKKIHTQMDNNHLKVSEKKGKRKIRKWLFTSLLLIVFEGLDGNGKSTQVELSKGYLIRLGYQRSCKNLNKKKIQKNFLNNFLE